MAWSDKPTYGQISCIFNWMRWSIDLPLATEACAWLEKKATRGQVSAEMERLKALHDKHALSRDNCFTGKVWEGFL